MTPLNETIMFFNGTPSETWTNSFAQTRTVEQVTLQFVNSNLESLKTQLISLSIILMVMNFICIFAVFFYDAKKAKHATLVSWVIIITAAADLGFFVRFITLVYKI